jgi:transcriptional regulator with XRE-family HTH domain
LYSYRIHKGLIALFLEGFPVDLKQAFGATLRALRQKKNRTQEDFYIVSSRTYISTLERGIKSPTMEKLDDIAGVLDVHPAALAVRTYMERDNESLEVVLEKIREDLS